MSRDETAGTTTGPDATDANPGTVRGDANDLPVMPVEPLSEWGSKLREHGVASLPSLPGITSVQSAGRAATAIEQWIASLALSLRGIRALPTSIGEPGLVFVASPALRRANTRWSDELDDRAKILQAVSADLSEQVVAWGDKTSSAPSNDLVAQEIWKLKQAAEREQVIALQLKSRRIARLAAALRDAALALRQAGSMLDHSAIATEAVAQFRLDTYSTKLGDEVDAILEFNP